MEASSLPALIAAMTGAEFYPHRPESVELRQTHISYVFLAGPYVYKVKKAVRFSFLDYSTLERRRHFCHEEIRLNSRLAPSVYLGVSAIVQTGGEFALRESPVTGGESVAEYAVKMRRLPDASFLDRLVREGRARREDFDRIAAKLADFYAAAAQERAHLYGSPEFISRNLANNIAELESFIGETLAPDEFGRIQSFTATFLDQNRDLLAARLRGQRIKDGHGDLRAEHICLEKDPVIFDCIEFNEELRYCDAASEIAFLSMDLDFLGAVLLSNYFVSRFQVLTRDETLSALLPLYKTYRACVRGKVDSLKSREREVPEEERHDAKQRARRYFQLAERYASGPFPAALLIVCGLAGSGKSTIARAVGARTGYQILNSDVARKQLAGIPLTARPAAKYGEGLYDETFTERTYDALFHQAEECLSSGIGVILDATFKDPRHRDRVLRLAERLGVPLLFAECRASERKTIERLRARAHRPDEVSDATVAVYLKQREEFAPLTELPESIRIVVDTDGDPELAAARVFTRLERAVSRKS